MFQKLKMFERFYKAREDLNWTLEISNEGKGTESKMGEGHGIQQAKYIWNAEQAV